MDECGSTRAQLIAQAASDFEREQTGRTLTAMTVALGGKRLTVTLSGVLSPAEQALARSPAGVALLQRFHGALFASACEPLRQEVARLAGVEVRAVWAEVQAASVPAETWDCPKAD